MQIQKESQLSEIFRFLYPWIVRMYGVIPIYSIWIQKGIPPLLPEFHPIIFHLPDNYGEIRYINGPNMKKPDFTIGGFGALRQHCLPRI